MQFLLCPYNVYQIHRVRKAYAPIPIRENKKTPGQPGVFRFFCLFHVLFHVLHDVSDDLKSFGIFIGDF